MRKTLFLISSILIIAMSACSSKKTASQSGSDDSINISGEKATGTLAFDSISWKDSTVFSAQSMAKVELMCTFPYAKGGTLDKGNAMLMDSIRCWICEQFDDSLHKNKEKIKELIPSFGKKQLKSDSKELSELQGDLEYACYEYDTRIGMEYEDENYITMSCMTYVYMAGAHGSTIEFCKTFSKKDGHRCEWELVSSLSKKELIEKIHNGLMEYFQIEGQTKAERDKALRELLFGDDSYGGMTEYVYNNNFPMPTTPPFLTKQGITMTYQQYEIACYAAGMPTFVIK